jgi:hypothetical protein
MPWFPGAARLGRQFLPGHTAQPRQHHKGFRRGAQKVGFAASVLNFAQNQRIRWIPLLSREFAGLQETIDGIASIVAKLVVQTQTRAMLLLDTHGSLDVDRCLVWTSALSDQMSTRLIYWVCVFAGVFFC